MRKNAFSRFNRRAWMAAAVSAAFLVPLGIFGAPALASSVAAASQYEYGGSSQYQYKVTICHRTHSKKHPFVQIIGQRARREGASPARRHARHLPDVAAGARARHEARSTTATATATAATTATATATATIRAEPGRQRATARAVATATVTATAVARATTRRPLQVACLREGPAPRGLLRFRGSAAGTVWLRAPAIAHAPSTKLSARSA